MEDNDDVDLLASLLDENEEEETVAGAGCSQDEPNVEESLEADEWDELFDKEEENGAHAKELRALFGEVDDLEEEEGESRSITDATEINEQTSPIPGQKKSEKSKLELEEELERMKEQMEQLQQQLTKVADGQNCIASSRKDSPDNKLKVQGMKQFLGQEVCTSQNIKKNNSFQQDRCRSSSSVRHDLLKSKSRIAPEPTKSPKERSPLTPPGNEQPRQHQNKHNANHQNLPTTSRAHRSPGTSRAASTDVSVDKFSGLRLRNPIVSSTEMERKMHGRMLIRFSQLCSKLANEKLEDVDWVTFGVIIKKITPQSSNNGKTFSIWNLSDLRSNLKLSLFLFGNVHKEHWKTDTGTVIGLLNANPMKSRDGTDEVCLSVDHPQKILVMGEALDMGTCRSRKKNGDPCTQIVNLLECEYCEYHVKAQYKKLSAKRADLQSSFSGRAPSRMNGKHGSLKERLCQQGFHYGGISSASYAASVKTMGPSKSVQMTLTQMMVKGADDIVRETKKNIALASGKNLTGCSEEFKDLMQLPTFGARNLKKHLTKAPIKVNNAQPGPTILSLSASELLKQQKQKMLETRKRKAEELQKSFLQSKVVHSSHTLGAGGLSTQTSPKVGAEFPKKQELVATPQTPKLGGGLSQGEDILFFDTSPPSTSKLSHYADTKKMAAIMKLRKKGAILAKEDPNSVKQKLPDTAEKLLERIEKNLSSPDGNDEPMLKKHRVQLEYLDSEEFRKILNAKSRHIGTIQEAEIEFQEQYFEPRVKKEQMEEKMKSIREMKCRVVTCKMCKYTYFKPLEMCVSENHDYHWHDAVKRFFKCPCGSRAIALTRLPKKSCNNCGLYKWERDGMLKERKGPKIGGELLLPRGEEHSKFLSTSK
ncbi:protein MCM10 homolog isoform X1 [Mobula birostris]|uniref:protein MCM10 homolog isoform X1 n=1 Tax=Mobula birostris TaxID=1983395 RepID=UPI003B28C9B3